MTDFKPEKTYPCAQCGTALVWLKSFKTGRRYPVELKADGTTNRSNFHKCKTVQQIGNTLVADSTTYADARNIIDATLNASTVATDTKPELDIEKFTPEDHMALELYIAANRDSYAAYIQDIFRLPAATKPVEPPKPEPVAAIPLNPPKPQPSAPGTKLGEYQCSVNPAHVRFSEVKPGKPQLCCERIMKFVGLHLS